MFRTGQVVSFNVSRCDRRIRTVLDLDESSLVFVAQFNFERSALGCINEKSISPRRITDRSHLVVLDLNK